MNKKQTENPKLYLIQNKEGKYYNSVLKSWEKKLFQGNFAKQKGSAELVIESLKLDAVVIESTELEFTQSMALETTSVVLKLESILTDLKNIHFNLPTLGRVNKNAGNFLGKTIDYLKSINPHFNEFVKNEEDRTFELQGYWEEMINELSDFEIYHSSEITRLLKAHKKDPKSMLGLAKKINK